MTPVKTVGAGLAPPLILIGKVDKYHSEKLKFILK
jgi:hypothetical protein